jgi:hypothetical protein
MPDDIQVRRRPDPGALRDEPETVNAEVAPRGEFRPPAVCAPSEHRHPCRNADLAAAPTGGG